MGHALAWAALALALIAAPAAAKDAVAGLEPLRARMASGELPNVDSLMVIQHGRTVAEWYFPHDRRFMGLPAGRRPNGPDVLHDGRSMSKTVVGLLLGVAIAEGKIKSLDDSVLNYFPEWPELRTPARMRIRLRDLVTMTSGLAWDEQTYSYLDFRNSEVALDYAWNPARHVLTRKIVARPGSRWAYSGGDVALIQAVLERQTGQKLEAYAAAKLFRPLGITRHEWFKDYRGRAVGWAGLRLSTRDYAKIGQLVLAKGAWRGRQVVPAGWVEAATRPHFKTTLDKDPDCGRYYGYFFWIGPGCEATPRAPYAAFNGNGGQAIWIVPSRDLVVVTTGSNYDNRPVSRRVLGAIMPAVLAAVD